MKICGKALPPRAAFLLSFDFVAFVLVLPALFTLPAFLFAQPLSPAALLAAMARLMFAGLVCEAVFYYNELYNLQIIRNSGSVVVRTLQAFGMLFVLLAICYRVSPELTPGLDRLLLLAILLAFVAVVTRLVALPKRRERVLIVSSGAESAELLGVVSTCPEWNMQVIETLDPQRMLVRASTYAAYETVDRMGSRYDRIIVCETSSHDRDLLQVLLECKMKGLRIEDAHAFYERATGRVRVDHLQPEWFVFSNGFENGKRKRAAKRILDLSLSALLIVSTLPVMAIVAAVIYLEKEGDILFSQDRTGVNGRPFRIYKFRTMRPKSANCAARWASEEDDRITRTGRFLRKYRLDELPQLFNILKGEMSLVGPRPEQPQFCSLLAEHIPYYSQRHAVPPGLTGWAQVRYHYGASIEESKRKLEFDLFYVKHLSLWLDFAILIETVKVVLIGRGAK